MEWKPGWRDMPRVTFRTNINVSNINLMISIIIINVLVHVDVCAAFCCFGLCLRSLAMLKEVICSCNFCESVAIYINVVFGRDEIG